MQSIFRITTHSFEEFESYTWLDWRLRVSLSTNWKRCRVSGQVGDDIRETVWN